MNYEEYPEIFTTNYGKTIKLLLEGLTILNEKYNDNRLDDFKKSIRTDIALLEEFLRVKSISEVVMCDRDYQCIKLYVDELINAYQ